MRVLFIGDAAEDLELLKAAGAGPPGLNWEHAESLEEGLKRLKAGGYDAVLLNFSLPDSSGLSSFLKVQAAASELAVVLLTGSDDEALAMEVVRRGAQDYLLRGQVDAALLKRVLRYAVERKKIERELARMASFPEINPGPLFELEGSGALRYANPAALKLFPELKELGARHPLLKDWALFAESLKAGRDELILREAALAGRVYKLHAHAIPKIDGVRFYAADITEQAKADKFKEEFLHGVSHELRSPIAAIDQAARLMRDGIGGELAPEHRKFLEILLKNALHLRSMVDDLLTVTRAETAKLELEPRSVRVAPLLQETLRTLSMTPAARELELAAELPEGLPELFADPVRLRQVLINLLDNAIKFSPPRGRVTVSVALDEGSGYLRFSVADQGPGIQAEELPLLFNRLYQGSNAGKTFDGRKGLGLGLYLCKQLVLRQGGRIWVESPEKGTRFLFTLPVFSLGALLKPLLSARAGQPPASVALIVAELWPRGRAFSAAEAARGAKEAREILKGCIFSDDLLLPELAEPGREGLLFVAAATHTLGARKIAQRIGEHLKRSQFCLEWGLRPRLRSSVLPLPAGRRKDAEAASQGLLARLERRIRSALAARAGDRA